ncbi:hypothetical protein M9458_021188, partial [Cirrhinus mrigala]
MAGVRERTAVRVRELAGGGVREQAVGRVRELTAGGVRELAGGGVRERATGGVRELAAGPGLRMREELWRTGVSEGGPEGVSSLEQHMEDAGM